MKDIEKFNSINNSTLEKSSNGYQRISKKGTLDQRLRNIVAYKRLNVAGEFLSKDSILSASEEDELKLLDENEEYFEEYEDDDEEAIYESLINKAIEQNKLSELKKNFEIDKASSRSEAEIILNKTLELLNDVPVNKSSKIDEEDLYTPARSSWGVFQRPRDISKSYGGGRVISREEMMKIDEEYERKQKENKESQRIILNEAMRSEVQNEKLIKDTLTRARNLMGIGDRRKAIEILEKVTGFLTWTSELGGETWLEYAMTLETVDRSEEARKIYGQLISVSWSQKVRRNSLQLLQGLDITSKIKNDLRPIKPLVDYESMMSISLALEKGLTNEWDDYKKDKKNNVLPYYDEYYTKYINSSSKVTTFKDAYYVLLSLTNPLKELPGSNIAKSFRKMYITNETDKVTWFYNQGFISNKKIENVNTVKISNVSHLSFNSKKSDKFADMKSSPTSGILSSMFSDIASDSSNNNKQQPKNSKNFDTDEVYSRYINGSWDLVISLYDKSPYNFKRYDSNSVVKTFNFIESKCTEVVPTLWGLSTLLRQYQTTWNPNRREIAFSGKDIRDISIPSQSKSKDHQCYQHISN
eukprot:gene17194-22714_t